MDLPFQRPLEVDGRATWTWSAFELTVDVDDTSVTAHTRREDGTASTRFLRQGGDLLLTARPADRHVVARPSVPLVLQGTATTTIYVSSPLWVGLAEGTRDPFFEAPTSPPKETWLGATPQAGRLAYATRTRARADLDHIVIEPGRLYTKLELRNELDQPWSVERVVVPMPHLAVYRCEGPHGPWLWTSTVSVARSDDTEVDAAVGEGPPADAGPATRLCDPREATVPRLSLLALSPWRWG